MNPIPTGTPGDDAARARLKRLRRIDRAMAILITTGALALILAVLGIGVFVFAEAVPLFRREKFEAETPLPAAVQPPARALAVGEDEYLENGWALSSAGIVRLLDFKKGTVSADVPLEELGGATLTCGARAAQADVFCAGTSDGRLLCGAIETTPRFEDGKRAGGTIAVAWQFALPVAAKPIERCTIALAGETIAVAASAEGFLGIATRKIEGTKVRTSDATALLDGKRPTALALDEAANNLSVGLEDGEILRLALDGADATLKERNRAGTAAITALAWGFGSRTLLVGDAAGVASGWQGVRSDSGPARTLSRVREFGRMSAAITAFAPSRRNKTFLMVDRAGNVELEHVTTSREIAQAQVGPDAVASFAPRADGATLVDESGAAQRFHLDSPYPEVSLRALFTPMLYEGYDSPQFVWQSTGGTDDTEPKFSLVPLVVGSLKGVLYAMLFSVPLAILAALYTSQFASARLRSVVKPTVELMGALPSVVIGFLAGLWLSPVLDRNLGTLLALIVCLPLALGLAALVYRRLPNAARQRHVIGRELRFVLPFGLLGVAVAALLGGPIERGVFGGDVRTFLAESLGVTYDPRNAVIVGIALGFAVIPIVFTVAEDAMSNVPRSLRAASDALGASRWQTAVRLVLPAASPGIFAALMLGFGRAIGETMIVLMATGNTPLIDLSPFTGMRTISACIATEMPEAPDGGTLFRVLFLAGGLLFVFAFLANTAAELVGERLRKRFARW